MNLNTYHRCFALKMNFTPVLLPIAFAIAILVPCVSTSFDQRVLCDNYCLQNPEFNHPGYGLYENRGLYGTGHWGYYTYLNDVAKTRHKCFQLYPGLCSCSSIGYRIVYLAFNPVFNRWEFRSKCGSPRHYQTSKPLTTKPRQISQHVPISTTTAISLTSRNPWTKARMFLTTGKPPSTKLPSTSRIQESATSTPEFRTASQHLSEGNVSWKKTTINLVNTQNEASSQGMTSWKPTVRPIKSIKNGSKHGRKTGGRLPPRKPLVLDSPRKPLMDIPTVAKWAGRVAPPNKPWKVLPPTSPPITSPVNSATLSPTPQILSITLPTRSTTSLTQRSTPPILNSSPSIQSSTQSTSSTTLPTLSSTPSLLSSTPSLLSSIPSLLSSTPPLLSSTPPIISTISMDSSTPLLLSSTPPIISTITMDSSTSVTLSTSSTILTTTPIPSSPSSSSSSTTTSTTTTITATTVKLKIKRKQPS